MTTELKRHADGVYLDLPLDAYVADDAIGGHGAVVLDSSPTDWRWQRADNPLYRRPKSEPFTLGSLVHCLTLEGRAAFDARYAIEPERGLYPDALDTATDMSAWLKRAEAEHCAKLGVEKLKQDERKPFLSSGKVEELAGRVRALDPGAQFWPEIVAEHVGDREKISIEEAEYARLATRLALAAYGELLEITNEDGAGAGLSEVSVFWTVDGVRFKARWDRITASRIVDLKKYGVTPKPQHCLRQHLVAQAASYSYQVMAVMQSNAAAWAAVGGGDGTEVFGGDEAARETLKRILSDWHNKREPTFWWLFLRCPGPPGGKPIPFRPSDAMWSMAEARIDNAVRNYRYFRERFGDDLWLDAQDHEEISSEVGEESDWPAWSWKSPMGVR